MPYGIGDGTQLTGAMANIEHSVGRTTAVGAYSAYANAYGLYDMHGYEWCLDWNSSYVSSPVTDPEGATTGSYRVLRGGYWGSHVRFCCFACRNSDYPSLRNDYVGFRVVFYP
jgi:formylglycine-generating enzyme required for sulfatase activity